MSFFFLPDAALERVEDELVDVLDELLNRHKPALCSPHTSPYVSIRQHTPEYVSIRQHTSATSVYEAFSY